jgi:phosphoenolpyruvate-protein kinase (PTS system EI component)
MAEIPEKITVITEQNMAICLTGIQKDVQYIKEKLDASVVDHENRIRSLEQAEEECQQTETFQGIQTTLNDHEVRINCLEDLNHQATGAKTAVVELREVIGWGLAGLLGIITLYQFMRGGL